MHKLLSVPPAALALLATALAPLSSHAAPNTQPARRAELSVVRVNSTNQAYDFFRPWQKKNPFVRHGLGAVLDGNRVLVTAELVANHNYIDLEKAESGEKTQAKVLCVDYESNLALLAPVTSAADDPAATGGQDFLAGLKPLEVATDAAVGDRVNVLQLESNDALVSTPGPITTVEVGRYQLENTRFLLYKLSLPLQFREGSFTAPVIDKGGRLAGLLMRYDPRSQTVDVLPGPVIAHFLKDFADRGDDGARYAGFPAAGLEYSPTRDPQLRTYAKLPAEANNRGIYVTHVDPRGAAAAAGLKPGDVILEVAGQSIDQDGNYLEPIYGRLALSHLLTTKSYVGQTVPVRFVRDGAEQSAEMTLTHRPPQDYVSEPYVVDRPPRYVVAGGLIFEELSRQYLKEWGGDWQKQAPQRLVYLDRYQSGLEKNGRRRVVLLSQVLPAASNIGYEDLSYLIVKAINGQPLASLDDVPRLLAQAPADGFHRVEFEDFPHTIFLDAAQLGEEGEKIGQAYGLPALSRLN